MLRFQPACPLQPVWRVPVGCRALRHIEAPRRVGVRTVASSPLSARRSERKLADRLQHREARLVPDPGGGVDQTGRHQGTDAGKGIQVLAGHGLGGIQA